MMSNDVRSANSLLIALAAVVFVMRGPVTCVGTLAEQIMTQFVIGYAAYGFLNALPILLFGLVGLATPFAFRQDLRNTVLLALVVVLAGSVLRLVPSYAVLVSGTILIGGGIACLNVVLPAILKIRFPKHIDIATGLFTGMIGFSGAVGTYASAPLWDAFESPAGPFGLWVTAGVVAVVLWSAVSKPKVDSDFHPCVTFSILKSPMQWILTLVMGMQSLTIYTTAAWLPTILLDTGVSSTQTALGTALYLLISTPASFLSPWIIRVLGRERRAAFFAAAFYIAGVCLWLGSGPLLFIGCLLSGIAQGLCLSLAMLALTQKTATTSGLLFVSSFVQGIGYVLAAAGPWVCGIGFEQTEQPAVIVAFMLAAIALWATGAWKAFSTGGNQSPDISQIDRNH